MIAIVRKMVYNISNIIVALCCRVSHYAVVLISTIDEADARAVPFRSISYTLSVALPVVGLFCFDGV